MKKLFCVLTAGLSLGALLAAASAEQQTCTAWFPENNTVYDGYSLETESQIEIDNRRYVSLKELADFYGLVYTKDENGNIYIDETYLSAEAAFTELFDFELPSSAKVINSAYSVDEDKEKHFAAKISFATNDLEYMKQCLLQRYTQAEDREENLKDLTTYAKTEYDWWNVPESEQIEVYTGVTRGQRVKTVKLYILLVPGEGTYEMYVCR